MDDQEDLYRTKKICHIYLGKSKKNTKKWDLIMNTDKTKFVSVGELTDLGLYNNVRKGCGSRK